MSGKWANITSGVGIVALLGISTALLITEPWTTNPSEGPSNQAPIPVSVVTAGIDVVMLPQNFRNVATFCDHGNRVYVTSYNGGSGGGGSGNSTIAVVPADPTCAGGEHE